jgi:hypothetical protein
MGAPLGIPEICLSGPRNRRFIVSAHSYRPVGLIRHTAAYKGDPKDQTRRGCRPCAEGPVGPRAGGCSVRSRDGGSPVPVRDRAKTVPRCGGLDRLRLQTMRERSIGRIVRAKPGDEARQDALSIPKCERTALGSHFVGSVGPHPLKQYLDAVGPDAAEGPGRGAYRSVHQALLITSPAGYLCRLARPTSVTADQPQGRED